MNILTAFAKIITIPLVAILNLAGYVPAQAPNYSSDISALEAKVENLQSDRTFGGYQPSGGNTYRLQASIGTTNTTVKLSSFKEPISSIPYTMTVLNSDIGYGTLDPQSSTRSEFISFTGVTQNSDGTATLTGVTRGLPRSNTSAGCTASTTLSLTHSGQSIFILSDSPCHFDEYAVKRNNETVTGSWSYPYPSSSSSPATMGFVLNSIASPGTVAFDKISVTATAGETVSAGQVLYFKPVDARWYKASPNQASSTLIGVAQGAGTAGAAVSGGVLIRGTDNHQANLTAGTTYFVSTTNGATTTATTSLVLGKANTTQNLYVDPYFLNTARQLNRFGGDGTDGALTISSGTTTVDCGGQATCVKNYSSISITGTGVLAFSSPNASGTVMVLRSQGDVTLTSSSNGMITTVGMGGGGGGAGGSAVGQFGSTTFSSFGVPTGGGPGGQTGIAGATTTNMFSVIAPDTRSATSSASTTMSYMSSVSRTISFVVGAGGGAGSQTTSGGTPGSGGPGAGALIIEVGGTLNFTTGKISAKGADGINATAGGANGGPGGGGGGGGGSVVVLYNSLTANSGGFIVSGGAFGLGGTGTVVQGGGGGGGGGSATSGNAGFAGLGTGAGGYGGQGGNGFFAVLKNLGF